MTSSDSQPAEDYPACLDLTNLPPTHNHLIGAVQAISLDNIRGLIALTRRLLTEAEGRELWLSEDQAVGWGVFSTTPWRRCGLSSIIGRDRTINLTGCR